MQQLPSADIYLLSLAADVEYMCFFFNEEFPSFSDVW
jgi:hypothetical protein